MIFSIAMIHTCAFTVAIIAALIAAYLVFRYFFEDDDEFGECVKYVLAPFLLSQFRGDEMKAIIKSLKLKLYAFLVVLAGAITLICVMEMGG